MKTFSRLNKDATGSIEEKGKKRVFALMPNTDITHRLDRRRLIVAETLTIGCELEKRFIHIECNYLHRS